MNHALDIKGAALLCTASIGGVFAELFGGWDVLIKALIVLIVVDYITGLAVAALGKSGKSPSGSITSNAAFVGFVRKVSEILLVLVAAQIETVSGSNFIRDSVAMFFIGCEGLSIIENTGLLGVPWPKSMKKWFEALRDSNDTGGGNDGNKGN